MEKKLDVKLSGDDTCAVSAHWSCELVEEREEQLVASMGPQVPSAAISSDHRRRRTTPLALATSVS